MTTTSALSGISFRLVLVGACAVVLGACSDTWLGDTEAPPLPGERISVLRHESALKPDASLKESVVILPDAVAVENWTQNGGNASHVMGHIKANTNPELIWEVDIGSGASDSTRFITPPIVANGKLFTIDTQSKISAFDMKNGERLWETELTPDNEDDGHIQGGLAFENGRIFVGTGFAQVIAVNANSGEVIWRRPVSGPIRSAPAVKNGRVFAVTLNNKLHALSAEDGSPLWTHSGSQELVMLLGAGSPAVEGGVVVVPYTSGELAALKVENGRQLWMDVLTGNKRFDQSAMLSQIRANPVIDRSRVFAISNAGTLLSIDLRTGTRIWQKAIGGQQTIWAAGDFLFMLTGDQELVAMERGTGRVVWVQSLPNFIDMEFRFNPILWSGPLLAGGRMIVASDTGEVRSFSPITGKEIDVLNLWNSISVSPIAAQGTILFLDDDATVSAYR